LIGLLFLLGTICLAGSAYCFYELMITPSAVLVDSDPVANLQLMHLRELLSIFSGSLLVAAAVLISVGCALVHFHDTGFRQGEATNYE